jgi:hypothetical protein
MDRRIVRGMTYLMIEPGRVVAAVLSEIAAIRVDAQNPVLVAQALASARLLDDPESVVAAPAAFARMMARLDSLHEGIDDDD